MLKLKVLPFTKELLSSLSPERWLPPFIRARGKQIEVGPPAGVGEGRGISLRKPLALIGIGKSAPSMVRAAISAAGVPFTSGLIASPECPGERVEGVECLKAPHPIPGKRSIECCQRIIDLLSDHEGDVLFFISGGGSASVELPAGGVDIGLIAALTSHLLRSGADIKEINALRRALSEVKGGGLLRWVRGRWASLIASDLYDDSLPDIASGPTVFVEEGPEEALRTIEKYRLEREFPSISRAVKRGSRRCPEASSRGMNILALSMKEGGRSASRLLEGVGVRTSLLREPLVGPVENGLRRLIAEGRKTPGEPAAAVGWGELSVKVLGEGLGGRCSEAALRALKHLREGEAFLAVATDGRDGNSPGAGGWVRGGGGGDMGEIERYLKESDSYTALRRMGGVIEGLGGGSNVADIYIYFRGVRLLD